MKKNVLIYVIFALASVEIFAQSAEQIVRTLDEMQRFDTMYAEGTMISVDRFGEKRSSYKSWSRGSQDFLVELTNVEERGQKVLKVDHQLYLFYPDAEEVIPMHDSALKQSFFGDVSYEDVTENRSTLDDYDVTMIGSEVVDGTDCWVIEMIAKKRTLPYPKKVIKVDKSTSMLKVGEYYAKSGRLLKTLNVLSFKRFGPDKVVITEMELIDKLRKNSHTRLLTDNIQVNPDISADVFSLQSLY